MTSHLYKLGWRNEQSELDVLKACVEGAAAGALRPFHELISKLAVPATEEMGLTWRDHVRVWRFRVRCG